MTSANKLIPDSNTLVNFQIAAKRLVEGHNVRRLGWDKKSRLETVVIGGKTTYSRANYKHSGQLKDRELITDVDTGAVDWMINQ